MSIIGTEPTNTETKPVTTLAEAKATHLLYLEEAWDAKHAHEVATAAYQAEQDRRHREYEEAMSRLSREDSWLFHQYETTARRLQKAAEEARAATTAMGRAAKGAARSLSPSELQELTRITTKDMPTQ